MARGVAVNGGSAEGNPQARECDCADAFAVQETDAGGVGQGYFRIDGVTVRDVGVVAGVFGDAARARVRG